MRRELGGWRGGGAENPGGRERLLSIVRLVPPRRRVKTKPSRGSKERRLKAKRELGEKKSQRRRPSADE